jgi:hypothetical protein
MAYIGQDPVIGRYIIVDQISGGFNGTASGFTLAAGGQGVIPGLAQNVLLSLGGVIQQPGTDYTVSGSGITFTTPPLSGTTFFATVLGDVQAVGTPSDGTVLPASIATSGTFVFPNITTTGTTLIASGNASTPSLAVIGDTNTGLYSPGADQLSITTGGTERFRIDNTGQLEAVSLGTAAAPTFSFTTDPNTGIYSPGADQVAISTAGSGRLFVDASGNVGVGTSTFNSPSAGRQILELNGSSSSLINLDAGGTRRAYIFSDSSDTYFYNTQAGPLLLGTNDTERLRITSAGLVGIGTSLPEAKLEVVDTASSLTYPIAVSNFTDPATDVGSAIDFRLTTGGNTRGYIACRYTSNSSTDGTYLSFAPNDGATGNVERVRITKAGNVGIGTTSPSARLNIAEGNANAVSTTSTDVNRVLFTDTSGSTSAGVGYSLDFEGTYGGLGRIAISKSNSATTGTTRDNGAFRLFLNQNLGQDSYAAFTEALTIDSGGTDQGLIYRFRGTEQIRVDNSGRLLVGTSSAPTDSTFVVKSVYGANQPANIYFTSYDTAPSAAGSLGIIKFSDSSQTTAAQIQCARDGGTWTSGSSQPTRLTFSTTADGASSPTERMRINKDGYAAYFGNGVRFGNTFGAGTAVAIIQGGHSASDILNMTTSFYVYTNGNVVNTNNSYGAISDIKLKENISDANSQWDDLKALQVRNYNFKEGQTHTQIGLVAQEAELVSPGLVSESPDRDEDGNDLGTVTKSVNYSVLYMKAVKALQEAMERIEQLEQRLTDAGIA